MIKTDNPDLSSVFKGFSMLGKKMTTINQGLINVSDTTIYVYGYVVPICLVCVRLLTVYVTELVHNMVFRAKLNFLNLFYPTYPYVLNDPF